ncbi:hypothetical protein AQULUS_17000 [Aquicella lusitana]|uniref:Putative NAD(P)/FAD-binding protein YdhS n=2 Tax=Aquicella lusitana TaxID=254246 RepID=A0A370H124_9COXI|nr:putative NAD(P)/FAD-binding protein YdhS [Aquicella lusitana]VVC73939.1 hypothetical protein AQULUS_17000 [Aquicella lusitana]
MELSEHKPVHRIGIIGAGFSGTAVSAALHRINRHPLEVVLFEKRGCFGAGDAYSTPFPFHLLNVRAQDMSVFEDEKEHFVNWLNTHSAATPFLDRTLACHEQFVPRFLYGSYLKDLLMQIQADSAVTRLTLSPHEIVDIAYSGSQAVLISKNNERIPVDKVVLALGNNLPAAFPFSVSEEVNCIHNPWEYTAPRRIEKKDPVLIVGTGLSMIDAVLTLYHQDHQGPIYAVSRHGLLPLSHSDVKVPYLLMQDHLPHQLRMLSMHLRSRSKNHINEGGDWRSIINALRGYIPALWERSSLADKSRFLRHLLPYWNIHRHRVHKKVADLLMQLRNRGQLKILAGRILEIEKRIAKIKLRHKNNILPLEVKWVINCMGPSLSSMQQPLVQSLLSRGMALMDPLDLGFAVSSVGALKETSGHFSSSLYTLGPPARGAAWECSAVPEIRKQSFHLAKHLLNMD